MTIIALAYCLSYTFELYGNIYQYQIMISSMVLQKSVSRFYEDFQSTSKHRFGRFYLLLLLGMYIVCLTIGGFVPRFHALLKC